MYLTSGGAFGFTSLVIIPSFCSSFSLIERVLEFMLPMESFLISLNLFPFSTPSMFIMHIVHFLFILFDRSDFVHIISSFSCVVSSIF